MWATMATMYKNEGGISALYRGIVPTVAGVAPYVSTLTGSIVGHRADTECEGGPQLYDI